MLRPERGESSGVGSQCDSPNPNSINCTPETLNMAPYIRDLPTETLNRKSPPLHPAPRKRAWENIDRRGTSIFVRELLPFPAKKR